MGFFKRLFTFSLSKKPKKENGKSKKGRTTGPSTSRGAGNLPTTPMPHDQDAIVNRLLRSSSTRFSVLSETDYHSLPPLPHPINNALRTPSVMTNSTKMTNASHTYTVTVHPRTIHSCTEFPNANGSTTAMSTPAPSPTKKRSIPPLTPGDKNRLEKLRQDASVISLLGIYDDFGRPNPESFMNTPAPRKPRSSTTSFKILLGEDHNPSISNASNMKTDEESDLSWADRCIRAAGRDSHSSASTASYLGMAADLFRTEASLGQLYLDEFHAESTSSNDIEAAFDSLNVEIGTAEDGSFIIQSTTSALTSRASQFFKFLVDSEAVDPAERPLSLPSSTTPSHLQVLPYLPRGPRPMGTQGLVAAEGRIPTTISIREGPKESQAQLSPAPRRRQYPPPLPPIPPEYQFRSSRPKLPPLGYRAPTSAEQPATEGLGATTRNVSNRTVSVVSSVHPQIEETSDNVKTAEEDPYTPIPRRPTGEGRYTNAGERIPPNAPPRPVRSQAHNVIRNKGELSSRVPLSRNAHNNKSRAVSLQDEKVVPVSTPKKHFPPSHLQTPSRPSPPSSAELSPDGRRIMAAVRAQALASLTPGPWQPLGVR